MMLKVRFRYKRVLGWGLVSLMLLLAGCASEQTQGPPNSPSEPVEQPGEEDAFLWLEEVEGERALAWVEEQNQASQAVLEASPLFAPINERLQGIYNSDARIPYVAKMGDYYYNFWRDADHPLGIWRRTTLEEYRQDEPDWETVLDIDALSQEEGETWVWDGADCLAPAYEHCLISLSRGGADATEVREFNLAEQAFVEGGFVIPEAKTSVAWRDENTIYVATDFGEGSMTESGYPRIAKAWQRGATLADAETVFEGEASDVGVFVYACACAPDIQREFIYHAVTFFTNDLYLREGETFAQIEKPADAEASTYRDQLLLQLKSDWSAGGERFAQGSLIAANLNNHQAGNSDFEVLFEPGERKSLAGYSLTQNHLIVNELDNVRHVLYAHRYENGTWARTELETPEFGTVSLWGAGFDSDDYFINVENFTVPSSLFYGTVGEGRELIKQLPALYDADGLEVEQFEATSEDGTKIPYFQISVAGLELDGSAPTLLYGYGGFEISLLPSYSAGIGSAWLERGGVYVVANIRGGGEFGPRWHQVALKENRQRAYDDFAAVAQDLVDRGVTSPEHLGAMGGSNGGLLTGVMLTQRPELFGAIVSQVPLLDMKRYHKLLAGASWVDEYGNPDNPEDWAYIKEYSPYQNLSPEADYPPVLFTTSTRDDRVHPGHARKMVAKMEDQGHDEVYYYENTEGGHAGGANNAQRAYMDALAYTFLLEELR